MPTRHALALDPTYTDVRSRVEALFRAAERSSAHPTEAECWRSRPLDPHCAILFLDSLAVKVKENGLLSKQLIHVALGVTEDGTKDIIAYWAQPAAKTFNWLAALEELQQRGLMEIDIAMIECGAAADALAVHFPQTWISLNPSLPSLAEKRAAIEAQMVQLPARLKALCTSCSAAESLIEKRRRRGHIKQYTFASIEAAVESLVLVLRDASASWKVSPQRWTAAQRDLRAWRENRDKL